MEDNKNYPNCDDNNSGKCQEKEDLISKIEIAYLNYALMCLQTLKPNAETLLMANDIIRHTDRIRRRNIPRDSYADEVAQQIKRIYDVNFSSNKIRVFY